MSSISIATISNILFLSSKHKISVSLSHTHSPSLIQNLKLKHTHSLIISISLSSPLILHSVLELIRIRGSRQARIRSIFWRQFEILKNCKMFETGLKMEKISHFLLTSFVFWRNLFSIRNIFK